MPNPTEANQKNSIYELHLQNQVAENLRLANLKKEEQQNILKFHQAAIVTPLPKVNVNYPLGRNAVNPQFSAVMLENAAEKLLKLVPIRLDVESDGIKIRDTFTWNLNESVITPDIFARRLCRDVGVKNPSKALLEQIVRSLKDQIEDYFQHAPEILDQKEGLSAGNDDVDNGEKDLPELRTTIKLDITIDQQCVVDQFEWDIACRRNNPEQFADQLVRELGLSPEFKTAIAHSIREQIQTISKSLLIVNHNFRIGKVNDESISQLFLPPVVSSTVRRFGKPFDEFGINYAHLGPVVSKASVLEIEKMEKDLERESRYIMDTNIRRKRRQTARSRRVTALPERENNKTSRTPLPLSIKFHPKNPQDSTGAEICNHCRENIRSAGQVRILG
jgi:SNF5 / SMARCB1 / INI1